MKQTKDNYETKNVTPHSLYLDYIKKVILELGNFTKWDVKLLSRRHDQFSLLTREVLCESYAVINLSKLDECSYRDKTNNFFSELRKAFSSLSKIIPEENQEELKILQLELDLYQKKFDLFYRLFE